MGEDRFEEIRKLSDELRDKGLRCSHCCRFWVHTDCKCYIFGKSYPGPAKCVYYLKKELERRQNSGKKGGSMKILTEIEKYVNASLWELTRAVCVKTKTK